MDECSIYVAQLHKDVDEDLLFELFTQAGPVKKVSIRDVRDSDARFALVEFEHEESVLFAIEIMNGVQLFGTSLSVKPRNNTKQETLYRQKKASIERRNHPHSLMASSQRNSGNRDRRDGGYESRDRDRDRNRDWDRERDRRGGNSGGNNRDNRDSWRNQNQDSGNGIRGGQWSGNRGNYGNQHSTPQILPHHQFINHMQQQQYYSAPVAYNGRWEHQPPPPPPPPQRNEYQTPHRRPDRQGFDRNNRDGGWRNNGRN